MTPDQIRQYLELYRDLGIDSVYRRQPATNYPVVSNPEPARDAAAAPVTSLPAVLTAAVPAPAAPPIPPADAAVVSEPASSLPGLAPAGDTLDQIRLDIGDCRRCRLSEARNSIVFGSGNEKARLVFVGEGPGADEDEQGLPFVGRAGQLLTQMIDNTAAKEGIPISRQDVYICNVVKCRPPENRTPLPDEMETCGQFLFRQLVTIQPKAICALGGTAMRALLNTKDGITKLRGRWHKWRDIPVMITYHPSYLLRQYNQQARREAWEDLKTLLHFVYD